MIYKWKRREVCILQVLVGLLFCQNSIINFILLGETEINFYPWPFLKTGVSRIREKPSIYLWYNVNSPGFRSQNAKWSEVSCDRFIFCLSTSYRYSFNFIFIVTLIFQNFYITPLNNMTFCHASWQIFGSLNPLPLMMIYVL